jgi:hypothetical protein
MGRPTGAAWRPLGLDEDPTPGDPQRVTDEVSHLSSVAATILNQISALQQIAGGGGDQLIGQYADKIRESASNLVGTLQTVHERYTKVTSALGGWESDLVTAQAMSLKALTEAETPYQQLQLLNGPTFSAPSTSPPTPQQQQEAAAHTAAMGRAQGQLNDAITDLHNAVQFRDDQASHWAAKINSASDDSLRDSWWDSFKDFIGKWSWLIKDICTVLEIVGAILAIIALFVSGAWLLAAFIVTAAALLGRTLLAATGNGSWLDVIMDAVALATLGLSGGLSGTGALVRGAEESLGEAGNVFNAIQKVASDGSELGQAASHLSDVADELRAMAEEFGESDLKDFADQADVLSRGARDIAIAKFPPAAAVMGDAPEASVLSQVLTGGPDLAEDVTRVGALKGALPGTEKLTEATDEVIGKVNLARGLILGGVTWSAGGIAVSGAPLYGSGDFGAEDPVWQAPWDFKWFDSADEVLTAAIPEPAQGAPGAGTPHFTVAHGPIGK